MKELPHFPRTLVFGMCNYLVKLALWISDIVSCVYYVYCWLSVVLLEFNRISWLISSLNEMHEILVNWNCFNSFSVCIEVFSSYSYCFPCDQAYEYLIRYNSLYNKTNDHPSEYITWIEKSIFNVSHENH